MMKLALLLVLASGQLAIAAKSALPPTTQPGVPATLPTLRTSPVAPVSCATAVDRKALDRDPVGRADALACVPTILDTPAHDVQEETPVPVARIAAPAAAAICTRVGLRTLERRAPPSPRR